MIVLLYLLSLLFSLYVSYLATFRTYEWDKFHKEPMDARYLLPRIAYVGIWLLAVLPVVNLIIAVSFLACSGEYNYYVKSWWLEKPEKNNIDKL